MYKQILFEELFEIPQRNGLTKPERIRGEGVKMVNMGELFSQRRISNLKMERVPCSDRELLSNKLKAKDLLFARQSLTLEGAGKCSIFLGDDENVVFESHLIRCRLDITKANPLYYFYFFESKFGRQRIASIVEQVAAAGIRGSDLVRLPVFAPPLSNQNAVAYILNSIDEKIEFNKKRNESLEGAAQAIFKSWFIDFDPVRAISRGTSTELSNELSKLFSGEFVESEFGEIPVGWNIKTLGDFVTPKKGKSITKALTKEGLVPVVAGGLQPAYFHNQSNVDGPVITISASGANAGFVRLYYENIWASDCSYIGKEQTKHIYFWYLFLKTHQEKIYFMQQGGAQPHVYPSDLMRLNLPLPLDQTLIRIFDELVKPFFDKIAIANEEIRILGDLRDLLLPKLISGDLQISNIEKFLEEVNI